jgi:hypothetical protein
MVEYSGSLRTYKRVGLTAVAERLRGVPGLVEFQLSKISK